MANIAHYLGIIDRYRDRLPIDKYAEAISLHEGNTPLLPLHNLKQQLGFTGYLYAKFEGMNPTGSFKDRGMTVAVTHAIAKRSKAILCASTGNTSASAAAYAARAKIKAFVIVPNGKIALGKLAQAMMHGATVLQIEGNFDDGMHLVKEITKQLPITLVNSINPFRIQGQKTAAFEVADSLGFAPDYHCLPVGNAGNITAYWMGYQEYHHDKLIDRLPIMLGYQAEHAAPLVLGSKVDQPETIATAIRIGNPQSWKGALRAQTDSGGWFAACSDAEILHAQKLLADTEGIFCEPASAISIAGLMKDISAGKIKDNSTIVCTLTGHGLKDPDTAIGQCEAVIKVAADLNAIKKIIGQQLM